MKFDRTTQADEIAKNIVKKKASKAARAAGKKAARATMRMSRRFIMYIVGLAGLPATLMIIVISIFFLIFPLSGFTGTVGLDATNETNRGEGIDFSVYAGIEESAERELSKRAQQLSAGAFWDDMLSFFGGGFKDSQAKFKTEYADAAFYDENGEEELGVYAGTFNRLVAIVNESLRASLRDSNVLKLGEAEAKRHKDEYEQKCIEQFPLDPEQSGYTSDSQTTYHFVEGDVEMEIKRDEALDDINYILQACYIVSASSVNDTLNSLDEGEEYRNAVKNALDLAFDITGMGSRGTNTEVIWKFIVTAAYSDEYVPGRTWYDYESRTHYYNNGAEISHEEYLNILNNGSPEEIAQLSTHTEYIVIHTHTEITHKRKVIATYSAVIKDRFKEIVLESRNLNEVPDNLPAYDMSARDLIEKQSMEFRKLYAVAGDSASLEDMGLPLPSGTYRITSGYGNSRGSSPHKGIDLAAAGGTPIYAMEKGTVERIYWGGGGYSIHVRLESGYLQVCYHMDVSSSNYVSEGQQIEKGTQIGSVGTTYDASLGGNSTGNHLHLEIHDSNGVAVPLSSENIDAIRNASTNPDSSEWDRDFI